MEAKLLGAAATSTVFGSCNSKPSTGFAPQKSAKNCSFRFQISRDLRMGSLTIHASSSATIGYSDLPQLVPPSLAKVRSNGLVRRYCTNAREWQQSSEISRLWKARGFSLMLYLYCDFELSALTVQQIKLSNSDYIGSANSLVQGLTVNNLDFRDHRLKPYRSTEEYDEALTKGSKNGGVSAIIEEIPYIKILLAKYPHKYTMIESSMRTSGFGFAYRKGSPLVHEMSRAISGLREEGKLSELENKWFKDLSPLLYRNVQQIRPNALYLFGV